MVGVSAVPASAHQPWFEDADFTPASPFSVRNPAVSTAVYATLADGVDVDYFEFEAFEGDQILLEITIPQIEGQEEFAPTMALIGMGLPNVRLPLRIAREKGTGGIILRSFGEATEFFEPFSRTSYWERQSERVTIPRDGTYRVAVWDEFQRAGRYTFVIGDREVPGGDWRFWRKLRAFWTPVAENPSQNPVLPNTSGLGN
jgi:hypothetical protein